MAKGFVCWEVGQNSIEELMRYFPPIYPDFEGHHVTLAYDVTDDYPLPPQTLGEVVGEIADKGVQALVVAIDGSTVRPDGKTFHITWSLDRAGGRFPSNSNDLLRKGYWPLDRPIQIALFPAFYERE